MKINEIIQIRRKALNMTQLQLAEKLDVSDKTVSRWELGIVYPNVDMIPRIAAILEISINELFGNSEEREMINVTEKRNYRQIAIFRSYFFALIGALIISLILIFFSVTLESAILLIIAILLYIAALITFFINRHLFSAFYKGKFYINEYKYHDAKITTIAICINNFVITLLLFSLYSLLQFLNIVSILVFTVSIVICFLFVRGLGYKYRKQSLIPLIITIILYCINLFQSILIFVGDVMNTRMIVIPVVIFNIVLNFFAWLTIYFSIKNE